MASITRSVFRGLSSLIFFLCRVRALRPRCRYTRRLGRHEELLILPFGYNANNVRRQNFRELLFKVKVTLSLSLNSDSREFYLLSNVLFTSCILFLLSNLFLSLSPSLVYTQAQAIKRKKRRTSSDNCDPCYDAKFLFSYYARERRDERTTDERTNAFLSTRSFFSSSRPSSRL